MKRWKIKKTIEILFQKRNTYSLYVLKTQTFELSLCVGRRLCWRLTVSCQADPS